MQESHRGYIELDRVMQGFDRVVLQSFKSPESVQPREPSNLWKPTVQSLVFLGSKLVRSMLEIMG